MIDTTLNYVFVKFERRGDRFGVSDDFIWNLVLFKFDFQVKYYVSTTFIPYLRKACEVRDFSLFVRTCACARARACLGALGHCLMRDGRMLLFALDLYSRFIVDSDVRRTYFDISSS